MRPLILMPTINSRHWNACYLQLLSAVQRCQHPPQAERSCWGGVGHELSCAGGVPSSVRPLLQPTRRQRQRCLCSPFTACFLPLSVFFHSLLR